MKTPIRVLAFFDAKGGDGRGLIDALEAQGCEVIVHRVNHRNGVREALLSESWRMVFCKCTLMDITIFDVINDRDAEGLDVPIVAIATSGTEKCAIEAMVSGACDYFVDGEWARLGGVIRRELNNTRPSSSVYHSGGEDALDEQTSLASHHSTAILRVIRDINRAVVRGDDAIALVDTVCRELVSSKVLKAVWVLLDGTDISESCTVGCGWDNHFESFSSKVSEGWTPHCCCRALDEKGIVVTRNPVDSCDACPLPRSFVDAEEGGEALTTAIRVDNKVYGFMCLYVNASSEVTPILEKTTLLRELADDLAFALRNIELKSEREQAEEALKKEAMRRQVLMGASRDGICIINQEHRVVEANQRFAEMLGYTPEEALSLHTWDFESMMSEEDIRANFADLTQTSATFESKHRRKDGSLYDVEVSASGASVGGEAMVFTVSRDITEKRELQASLAQSDRLATMGLLAAGVAHEINNPLAYVLYNLESLTGDIPRLISELKHCREEIIARGNGVVNLERERESPLFLEDVVSRLNEALTGTRRIQNITRSLGTFSRVETQQLIPVNLHYIISCAINMAFNEIKYRARLVKDFSPLPNVLASEGCLSQVFLNLLINAAHAIGEGNVEENEIRIRTWQDKEEACIEVRDTGEGIPKENLERIFEPFYSTKSIGVGSGLGLSITRNIITGFGGRIEAESEIGKGTCFHIRLPINQAVQSDSVAPKEASSAPQKLQGRVLVVDDEVGLCRAMKRILSEHEVVSAYTGDGAKSILESDQAFDLILCDMMMPAMSGMELHRWLAETHSELANRFVFITGGAFTPKAREYLVETGKQCLDKPFDSNDLQRMVSELIVSFNTESDRRSPLETTDGKIT